MQKKPGEEKYDEEENLNNIDDGEDWIEDEDLGEDIA